jgi:hypothetical protein
MKTMKSNSKETNRIKEPSKFVIKFANTMFILGTMFSVLVGVYSASRQINNPAFSSFYYTSMLFSALSAFLFVLGLLKLRDELKVNMAVMFITTIIAAYGIETYLQFNYSVHLKEDPQQIHREIIAELMGVPIDSKAVTEKIDDFFDSGISAYPNVYPNLFTGRNGFNTSKGRIFPLGGISNRTTHFLPHLEQVQVDNKSGFFPVIEGDEYGFNNPKGLYQKTKVDIVLTGDSFTEGYSVHSDETISAVLRGSGFNALSIGKGGNGPLVELAALKEYAEPIKPKIVLWLYFANDFANLSQEISSPILKNYLIDNEFTQNLISRQEEIDSLLVDYVESERWIYNWKYKIIRLWNLRKMFNLTSWRRKPAPTAIPKTIFKDILQKSKQMVSGWGGELYFVYLPPYDRYSTGNAHVNRELVMRTATKLGLPIIDIHKEVFVARPDPLSLFPLNSHYNAEGYRLVAEAILNRLKADGIVPLN